MATVSRAEPGALTSKETREQVLQAVAGWAIASTPTQALATQSSDTLGVVVMDVSDPFFGASGESGRHDDARNTKIPADR